MEVTISVHCSQAHFHQSRLDVRFVPCPLGVLQARRVKQRRSTPRGGQSGCIVAMRIHHTNDVVSRLLVAGASSLMLLFWDCFACDRVASGGRGYRNRVPVLLAMGVCVFHQ